MESSRMTYPSCDPFDQAIIDTIIEYVDGRPLSFRGERLYLYEDDVKWAKKYPNGAVGLIFIDEDGFTYRLTVPTDGIMPKGYYFIEWFGRCDRNEF